eukprot:101892-Prorocentrum_minimum.AAC.10
MEREPRYCQELLWPRGSLRCEPCVRPCRYRHRRTHKYEAILRAPTRTFPRSVAERFHSPALTTIPHEIPLALEKLTQRQSDGVVARLAMQRRRPSCRIGASLDFQSATRQ